MPANSETFYFPAPILRRDTQMFQHYIPVPTDIAQALEAGGSKRVIATISGISIRRALFGSGENERFFVASLDLIRQIGASVGDVVHVDLKSDPDPHKIDLGEEFETVLELDSAAAERFNAMTTGRQRSLAHYVTSAKRIETRIKRALELAHKLRTNTLYGDEK